VHCGAEENQVRIYVASSWRNQFQQDVVKFLREDGHQVYDFKGDGDGWGESGGGPGGFSWSEVDPEWQSWTDDIPRYLAGLNHPRAVEGFRRDMDALEACDACVMVMPCGPSASMEMGWAVGANRLVYVYMPGIREPDLMVKMADVVTDDFAVIRNLLYKTSPARRDSCQRRIGAWYIKNGGSGTPFSAYERTRKEMMELGQELIAEDYDSASEELADVVICLNLLASKIGCSLQNEVRVKMDINEVRKWEVGEDGTFFFVR